MIKKAFTVALCGMGLVAALSLTGCGASLDRDIAVADMTMSVPSGWAEQVAEGNTEAQGSVTYEKFVEDADDEAYTAIVVSYEQPGDDTPANAQEAIALKQQSAEEDYGVTEWSVDDDETQIVDGAQVTTYEYSFEKEIDHVSQKYEYKTAYVFSTDMTYEITVYGGDVAIGDIVKSIEL